MVDIITYRIRIGTFGLKSRKIMTSPRVLGSCGKNKQCTFGKYVKYGKFSFPYLILMLIVIFIISTCLSMQLRMYKPVNVVFMDEKNLTSKMFVGSSVPNEEYRICSIIYLFIYFRTSTSGKKWITTEIMARAIKTSAGGHLHNPQVTTIMQTTIGC